MKSRLANAFGIKMLGGIIAGVIFLGIIAQFVAGSSMNSSTGTAYTLTGTPTPGMTSGAWDIGNVALDFAHHLTGPMLDNFDEPAKVELGIEPAPQGTPTTATATAAATASVNTNTNMSVVNPNANTTGTGTNTNNASNAVDQQILKNAKTYWQKQCHGICPIPFQCAMFVETVYGAAGHPLPQTYDAVDYFNGYKGRDGWKVISLSDQTLSADQKLPAVGDMVVWDGGITNDTHPNGLGHIAIVVAVNLSSKGTPTPGATMAVSAQATGTSTTDTPIGTVTVAQANSLTTATGNFVTPSPMAPEIKMPGIHLYQMPIMPDYSVKTWGPLQDEKPYHVLGYIRNTTLQMPAKFANALTGAGYSVVGPPTITADHINRILAQYKSPAAGKGQALYDRGVKYGIDPVYALAFFHHESTYGTKGEATKTLGLGNLRCLADRACVDQANGGGFAQMQSWEDGFEQWYKLIAGDTYVKSGLVTVDKIVHVYAPTADHNNEALYVKAVTTDVDQWRSEK